MSGWIVDTLPSSVVVDNQRTSRLEALKEFFGQSIDCGSESRFRHALRLLNEFVTAYCYKIDEASSRMFIDGIWNVVFGVAQDRSFVTLSLSYRTLSVLLERFPSDSSLALDWKPLYESYCKFKFPKMFPDTFSNGELDRLARELEGVINKAKPFFSSSHVDAILSEFLPHLSNVHHSDSDKHLGLLLLFLPNSSWQTWAPPLLKHWSLISDHPTWDARFFRILALVARKSLSSASFPDFFSPSIVQRAFTIMLSRLDIILGGQQGKIVSLKHREETAFSSTVGPAAKMTLNFAKFVAYSLRSGESGEKDDIFFALERFVETTFNYYHPSNAGKWSEMLGAFLSHFSQHILIRHRKQNSNTASSSSSSLCVVDEERIVRLLMPVANMALWSKESHMAMAARTCFRNLSYLAPHIVFPVLLERLTFALETQVATHQTTQALETLATVAHPLLSRSNYSPGAAHLPMLLRMAVPGINANDQDKTSATFKFFCSVLQWVPLVDESSLDADNLSHDDAAAKDATSCFNDWVLQVWDQLKLYFEMLPSGDASSPQSFWDTSTTFSPFVHVFFAQMNSKYRATFIKDHVAPYIVSDRHMNAVSDVALFLKAAVASNPEQIAPLLVKPILAVLCEDGKVSADASASSLSWFLPLLSACASRGGAGIVPFLPDMLELVLFGIKYESRSTQSSGDQSIREKAAALASSVLRGLLSVHAKYTYFDESKSQHFLTWGSTMDRSTLGNAHWSEPMAEATEIVVKWTGALQSLAESFSHKINTDSDSEVVALCLGSVLSLGHLLPACADETPVEPRRQIPGVPPFANLPSILRSASTKLESVRQAARNLIFAVHRTLLDKKADNPQHFVNICRMLDSYLLSAPVSMTSALSEQARKAWKIKVQNFSARHCNSKFFLVWKSENHLQALISAHVKHQQDTDKTRAMLSLLVETASSHYAVVRSEARSSLTAIAAVAFPAAIHQTVIPNVLARLEHAQDESEMEGMLSLLLNPVILDKARRYASRRLFSSLLQASRFDVPKIQNLVVSVFSSLAQLSVNRIKQLPQSEKTVKAYVDDFNQCVVQSDQGIINDTLEAGSSGKLHWRYQMMAAITLALHMPEDRVDVRIGKFFAQHLISDIAPLREVALCGATMFLKRAHSDQAAISEVVSVVEANMERFLSYAAIAHAPKSNSGNKPAFDVGQVEDALHRFGLGNMTRFLQGFSSHQKSNDASLKLSNIRKHFPVTPISADMSMFQLPYAVFWKVLTRAAKKATLWDSKTIAAIEQLLHPSKTVEENAFAIEFLGGVMRGARSCPDALVPVLANALPAVNNAAHYHVVTMLRFVCYNRSYEQLSSLLRIFSDMLKASVASSSSYAKVLRYVDAILIEAGWKLPDDFMLHLFNQLCADVSHPYRQVRLAISSTLYTLSRVSKARLPFIQLLQPPTGADEATLSHFRDTVLLWLQMAIRGQCHIWREEEQDTAKLYIEALKAIMAAHADPDKEVSALAKSVSATASLILLTSNQFKSVADFLLAESKSNTSWKVRSSLPLQVTLLDFSHRFIISNNRDASQLLPVALQLVQDVHIEVRQVAELALRSMLTGQPHLVDRVLSASETWATSDDAFHASTLVLSAIVLSCAYTVPPYVPPVLMKLASIASSKKSSAHVSATVRQTMMEFWRTHQDAWEVEHEQRFDPQQLSVIRNLMISPSYYA